MLWPYGQGNYERQRRQRISFSEYIQWALEYYDKRFRTHHSFPFIAFSIRQKQSALLAAKVQMRHADFEADGQTLAALTVDDLHQVGEEDWGRRHGISNERVRILYQHVHATTMRVMGSDKACAAYCSQIWSGSLWLRPPSLWMTINPVDYDDPVAQIFAGEQIDMDNFLAVMGPDRRTQSRTIAKDPFASAAFFRFIIYTILETLFGI